MLERRAERTDRRREVRSPMAGMLSWRKLSEDRAFTGWISDFSPSSISFVSPRMVEPSHGELIEMAAPNRPARMMRVTRVASYDDNLSLIACQNFDADD